MVDIRRKDRNGIGSRYEMIRMFSKVIKHWKCRNESAKNKYKYMLPMGFQKIFIRENKPDKEDNEDERCETEGDISMQTKTKDDTTPKE